MLNALPARPLYPHEIDALIESDALRFAFPAMPQSLRYDEDNESRIYELFIFLDNAVVAVAYVEEQAGWVVVAKEQGEKPYATAFDALVDYRGYVEPDEEKAKEVVKAFYDAEYKEIEPEIRE